MEVLQKAVGSSSKGFLNAVIHRQQMMMILMIVFKEEKVFKKEKENY